MFIPAVGLGQVRTVGVGVLAARRACRRRRSGGRRHRGAGGGRAGALGVDLSIPGQRSLED